MNPVSVELKSYIIDSWEKHFAKTNRKLVIYGIGRNTELILNNSDSGNVVGLMDGVCTDGTVYGKPIITFNEAAALKVDAIVIVAQANNIRIIYRRIADACAANSIDVYDISGDIVNFNMEKSFEKYANISAQILKDKIDKADVVSFDIFDTLVMRRTLHPRDIFALAGKRLCAGFYELRINAETELYNEGKNPNIYDIYERMRQKPSFGEISPEIELELESRFLIRREAMVAMLQYARSAGKIVYFVSDMYLPKDIMKGFLDSLDIPIEIDNLLVSCDHGLFKSNGLFNVLRSLTGGKKILHIGDNYDADIESAKRYGIDDAFHIEKSYVMLEDSYASDILKYENSLPNRMLIAEFISRQLNDPFLFSKTCGKFALISNYEMAYSLIAPLVYCFFGWLIKQSRELQIDMVLLSSRDGFIIERIYEILKDKYIDLPPMAYFYTSRAAALLAGIIDDEDIRYIAQYIYVGKIENMLKQRLKLNISEILPRDDFPDLDDEEYVLLHRDVIMFRAETARKNYKKYIDKFRIPDNAKVGFFDFVSTGTCLKALSNFADFKLTGLFFAVNADYKFEHKSRTKINSMFGSLNLTEKTYNFMQDFLFLENIFVSYEPTLSGFEDDGSPTFMEELRTERQIQDVRDMHTAIVNYIKNSKIELSDICNVDKAVPDFLLKLLHSQYSQIDSDYFDSTERLDEFVNITRNFSYIVK